MRSVITAEEVARLDEASETSEMVLMERAGLAVALAAVRMGARYGTRVIVLAGTGNNGGDGYVAARHLKERGVDVVVRCLAYPKGSDSARRSMAFAAAKAGVPIAPIGYPEPADLIIDALFGVGFHGSLPDSALAWLAHPAPVLAVDVPSGLDATAGTVDGSAFRATTTVSFHALKTGHLVGDGPEYSGAVEVADIGLSGEVATWLLCEDADAARPARRSTDHKWSAGSVAVVGGSPGIGGAAVLAAQAAVAFGAGAVRLVVPQAVRAEVAAMDPGLMTQGCGSSAVHDDPTAVLAASERFDVLALGPGLGAIGGDFVTQIAGSWERPLVLDADAISLASVDVLRSRTAPTVITPHAGEFERLTGEPATPEAAAHLARQTGTIVVLKVSPTFVFGAEPWVVTSGGPELATIGTGDVLTGMVAALIARGLPAEAAARSAAYWHGRTGTVMALEASVTAPRLAEAVGRFAW